MAFKQDPPWLQKAEEKQGKDLDGDGEKGESPVHKAKVLGKGKKPPFVNKAGGKGGKKKTMCAACVKAGASSCSH